MRASSDGWSVTVRAFVRPGCWFTARRYGIRPVGIHWISHTVFGTSQYCMDSVRSQTRSASMCGRYAYRKKFTRGPAACGRNRSPARTRGRFAGHRDRPGNAPRSGERRNLAHRANRELVCLLKQSRSLHEFGMSDHGFGDGEPGSASPSRRPGRVSPWATELPCPAEPNLYRTGILMSGTTGAQGQPAQGGPHEHAPVFDHGKQHQPVSPRARLLGSRPAILDPCRATVARDARAARRIDHVTLALKQFRNGPLQDSFR